MSNIQEHNNPQEVTSIEEMPVTYTPRWSECIGVFNEGVGLSNRENEETHYLKHVIVGREWDSQLTITEYRELATERINDINAETTIELCQTEDLAVVKYNIDTGEVGIARRDDGLIKTFFRPNDIHYILRKVDAGLWGEPDIADGFEFTSQASFTDDPHKRYLFERLEILALELPSQSNEVVMEFAGENVDSDNLLLLISRLGEYRFIIFELQRRVLTEEQRNSVFVLRKIVTKAVASFEALEKYRSQNLIHFIKTGLMNALDFQEELWARSTDLILELDEFDSALIKRSLLGFAMTELRVLQLYRRMLDIDLLTNEQRLRKSDIFLKYLFYKLALRFNYRETNLVSPENFFWRQMAERLPLTENINQNDETPERVIDYLELNSHKIKTRNIREITMSNPHYTNDIVVLDGKWDLSKLINSKTIIITTGCSLHAELLDRPHAEILRDEIDNRGDLASGKRAIVISDIWWMKQQELQDLPTIAIGGPNTSQMVSELTKNVGKQGINSGIYNAMEKSPSKIALWGEVAAETRTEVEKFIQHPEGLKKFLRTFWD